MGWMLLSLYQYCMFKRYLPILYIKLLFVKTSWTYIIKHSLMLIIIIFCNVSYLQYIDSRVISISYFVIFRITSIWYCNSCTHVLDTPTLLQYYYLLAYRNMSDGCSNSRLSVFSTLLYLESLLFALLFALHCYNTYWRDGCWKSRLSVFSTLV